MALAMVTLPNGLWETPPEIRSKMELLVPRNQICVNEEQVLLLMKTNYRALFRNSVLRTL
jgi:hypothetical protein